MKSILLPVLFLLLAPGFAHAQAISINTDGSNPAPSAILDVKSTDKGILVPRMTSAQRTAIASPAIGLLVFDTDTGGFWFYNGTVWSNLSGGSGNTLLQDADGNTKVQVEKFPNEDIIRFDLGGTENMVLRKNAGDVPRLELVNSLGNTFVGQNAGNANTTGSNNTAHGFQALNSNTTGNNLVAVGDSALFSNTTGSVNTANGSRALFSNTTGSSNTANGYGVLYSNTTGYWNTANGVQALFSNTTGNYNTAIGTAALYRNNTGYFNTATGSLALLFNTTGNNNTANGFEALFLNTTGSNNTANGGNALLSNTTGYSNTANGYQALYSNTTGFSNIALGSAALYGNTIQSNLVAVGDSALYNNGADATETYEAARNTAVGSKALFANNTGYNNTANGYRALYANTYGSFNTAVGNKALSSNTQSYFNTAVGNEALSSNTQGSSNTAVGNEALSFNTSGSGNTAVGSQALIYNGAGTYNTAIGYQALHENYTGSNNVANGAIALHYNIAGSDNTAFGYGALYYNKSGSENAANGYRALLLNTIGNSNTANGAFALINNSGGNRNSANGQNALYNNLGGSSNTADGSGALFSNTMGNFNTALGYNADVAEDDFENASAIGAYAMAGDSNCMVLGSINGVNGATSSVKVGIGVTVPSHYFTVRSPDTETMRLLGPNSYDHGARLNFGDGDYVYIDEPIDDAIRIQANFAGIGRAPTTNQLEVEGNASKTTAGDWLANSDARLKKNIRPLQAEEMLQKMLALQGVTYEWNDDKTGSRRPDGVHYGFTAQNIQQVFPTLVEPDALGYLQTAYGTYDAMTVEAIRALNGKVTTLQAENEGQKALIEMQKKQLDAQSALLQKITAALQTAGIGIGN